MDVGLFRKLVIVSCVLGLVFLGLYTHYYQAKAFSVYDFIHLTDTNKYLDKTISLEGSIRYPEIRKDDLFFKLCFASTCIDCVLFRFNDFQKNKIYDSTKIKIIGKYVIYNNQQEIIVYRLEDVVT